MTYSVRMTLRHQIGNAPAASHVYLEVKGRSEWKTRRAAKRHRDSVACDVRFIAAYVAFEVVEN